MRSQDRRLKDECPRCATDLTKSENVYVYHFPEGGPRRVMHQCRICRRERNRTYMKRRNAEQKASIERARTRMRAA
jgi:hypothetical protein